jgi:hypothetical protein
MAESWVEQYPPATPVDVALHAEGVASGPVADIARSIYEQESGSGKNTTTSNAGAVGGMQMKRGTFQRFADAGWNIKDPVDNARAAVRFISSLHERGGGDPALTAAGYYGGEGGQDKAKQGIAVKDPRNPDAPDTLQYAQQVLSRLPKGEDATAPAPATAAVDATPAPADTSWLAAYPEVKADPAQRELPAGVKPSAAGGGRGKVNPPAATPAPRSTVEDLARQAGLTVRAGVKGALAIPGLIVDAGTGAVNDAADLVAGKGNGPRFPRSDIALDQALTTVGLPQPENATERVVQDVTGAMAGAGGSIALAKQVAKSAQPVVSAVGKEMARGPALQTVSAATGGGASGIAREEGASPAVQAAAGVVGSLVPVAGAVAYNATRPTRGNVQLGKAAQKANDAGYVVPPADLNPGPIAEVVGAVGGKVKTAQTASQRNQTITNQLARKALDLPEDAPLDLDALNSIRREAAQAYSPVAKAGTITPTEDYAKALDDAVAPYLSQAKSFPDRKVPSIVQDIQSLKTEAFDAGDAVHTIRVLRSEADVAYHQGDRMAGSALKQAAGALEDQIQLHLEQAAAAASEQGGEVAQAAKTTLDNYRAARQTIAKTYSVESALNAQTGDVNPQVLARALKKGAPLADELRTIAETAQAFPKAMQALREAPKQLGIVDVGAGIAGGLHNPWWALGPLLRPVARAAALSEGVQSRAAVQAGATFDPIKGVNASPVDAAGRVHGAATAAPATALPAAAPPAASPPDHSWLNAYPSADASAAPPAPAAPVPPPSPPSPDRIAQVEALRAAGEKDAADHLQRIVDREQANINIGNELQGMKQVAPELPIHDKPVFSDAYSALRLKGTKPAEAAGRASMEAMVRSLGPSIGLAPKAIDAVIAAAHEKPLADAPQLMVNFAQAMAARGQAKPLPEPQQVVNTLSALRDHAMQAAVTHVYRPQPPAGLPVDAPAVAPAPPALPVPEPAPAPPSQAAIQIDQAAHQAATSPLNDLPEPSPAQQQAMNYKMGHVRLHGLDISIENPAGSTRRGVDPDGNPWESQMAAHYGRIKGSRGADDEHVDVFVGPDDAARKVYVVDQLNADGSFDEHKSLMNFPSAEAAKAAYLASYEPGWERRIGAVTELPIAAFKAWAKSGHLKEPLGELQHASATA